MISSKKLFSVGMLLKRSGILLFFFFAALPLSAGEPPDAAGEKNLLLIYSYSINFSPDFQIAEKLNRNLSQSKLVYRSSNLELNSFDTSEQAEQERTRELAAVLPQIRSGQYNIIVSFGSTAMNFVARYASEIPNSTAIVYSGLDLAGYDLFSKHANSTGVWGRLSVADNIEFGMRLFPKTKRVVLLTDWGPDGTRTARKANEQRIAHPDLDIRVPNNHILSSNKLLESLRGMPKDTIILFYSWFGQDSTNLVTLQYLKNHLVQLGLPIFVLLEPMQGNGVIGGVYAPVEEIGKVLAEYCEHILKGAKASDCPVVSIALETHLNWSAVESGMVSTSQIPGYARVMGKTASLSTRLLPWIAGFSLALVILSGITILIWRSRQRWKRQMLEMRKDYEAIRLATENLSISLINFAPDFRTTRARGGCRLFRPVENGRQIALSEWFSDADCLLIRRQIGEVLEGRRDAMDVRMTSRYKTDAGEQYRILAKLRSEGADKSAPEFVGIMQNVTRANREKEIYLNGLLDTIVHSGCHLFMYYPQERRCVIPEETAKLFHCRTEYWNMPESFADDFVNDEDREEFCRMYAEIDGGASNGIASFRNRPKTARCRVTLNCINRDPANRSLEVIGLIQNQSADMAREQKLNQFITALGGDYIAVLSLDRHSGMVELMRTVKGYTPFLAKYLEEPRKYDDFIRYYIENMIAKDDVEDTASRLAWPHVAEELAQRNSYTVRYKRFLQGSTSAMEAKFVLAGEDNAEDDCCVLAFRRIDDEVRREEELQIALAADKAKSAFLATMSHEIRTPLNAVIGFSELLQTGDVPPRETQEYIEGIHLSGKALLTLINDILDLSKLDAGQMKVVAGNCFLPDFLKELSMVFLQKTRQKNLELKVEAPESLPTLSLDVVRLRQILFNLLGNAVKFTEHGSITIRVAFTPEEGGGEGSLSVAVADTGCGIPRDFQPDLFKPFTQANVVRDAHAFKGTGLGLAISKRLAQVMGGDLLLESEEGKGSTFTLRLEHIPVVTAESAAAERKPGFHTAPGRARTVLLVDDVPMNLKVLGAIVLRCGATPIFAGSGEEALQIFHRMGRKIDLVLTDLWMPGMNGEQLADAIHQTPGAEDMPIAVVTADQSVGKTFRDGLFIECLTKPITIEKVLRLIDKGAEGKR